MTSLGFVFPGQGSQFVGMGADMYQRDDIARGVYEEADRRCDCPITSLCFQGPAEELRATENAQPCLLTTSYVLLETLMRYGVRPSMVAGHSLGEYSALVAAGVLTFGAAVVLARRRGLLMAAALDGTMAAIIGLVTPAVEQLCDDAREEGVLVPANYNSPNQTVVSGDVDAVQRAVVLARQRGGKAMLLNVSGAFHSPLMETAAQGLGQAIRAASFHDATIPVVCNVDAATVSAARDFPPRLSAQLCGPVRWRESVQSMIDQGVTAFVEIGPGKALAGLIRQIAPGIAVHNVSGWDSIMTVAAELSRA